MNFIRKKAPNKINKPKSTYLTLHTKITFRISRTTRSGFVYVYILYISDFLFFKCKYIDTISNKQIAT